MLSCPSDRSHFILHSEVSFSGVGTWFVNSRDWVWFSSRIGILELRLYSSDWSHDPGLVTSTWNAGTRWLLWMWSLVCIVCSRTDLALQWDSISNKVDITKLKTAPNLVSNSATVFDILCQCVNGGFFWLWISYRGWLRGWETDTMMSSVAARLPA